MLKFRYHDQWTALVCVLACLRARPSTACVMPKGASERHWSCSVMGFSRCCHRSTRPPAAWSMMIIICTTATGRERGGGNAEVEEDGRRSLFWPSFSPSLFLPVGHAIMAFSGGLQWPDKLCSENRSRFLVAPFFFPSHFHRAPLQNFLHSNRFVEKNGARGMRLNFELRRWAVGW